MKTLISASLLATLAITGATSAAFAKSGDGEGRGGPRAMFKAADTDEDGALSKEEFVVHFTSKINEFDADGNGIINQADITAMQEEGDDDKKKKRGGGKRLKVLDADWNGEVTAEEIASAAESRFERMDADGDGKIDRKDMKKRWKKGKKGHDKRGDQ